MTLVQLQRLGVVAGVCVLAAGTAKASTYQVTGSLDEYNGNYSGTLQVTFDATGFPITDEDNIAVTIYNVSAVATLDGGPTFTGSGGSGSVEQDFGDSTVNILDFSSGAVDGEFYLPLDFNGTGPLLSNDASTSSIIHLPVGDDYTANDFYFGGSSAEVTPEPESLTLLLSGVSASGLGMWGRRRFLRSR